MRISKIDKAIKLLRAEYEKAQDLEFVHKPMAYALYQVWKYFDETEKDRKENADGMDSN